MFFEPSLMGLNKSTLSTSLSKQTSLNQSEIFGGVMNYEMLTLLFCQQQQQRGGLALLVILLHLARSSNIFSQHFQTQCAMQKLTNRAVMKRLNLGEDLHNVVVIIWSCLQNIVKVTCLIHHYLKHDFPSSELFSCKLATTQFTATKT